MKRHILVAAVLTYGSSGLAKQSTQKHMQSIYTNLLEVFPLTFEANKFSQKANKPTIEKALLGLSKESDNLYNHGLSKNPEFAFLSNSLKTDAKNALSWYEKGYFERSRFTIQNLTENCLSCHEKRAGKTSPLGSTFANAMGKVQLQPLDKARLHIITRQFDSALEIFEKELTAKGSDPRNIIYQETIEEYLKLSIRVSQNTDRPLATLATISKSKFLPVHLDRQLKVWSSDLAFYKKSSPFGKTAPLTVAQKIIEKAQGIMEYPKDKDGYIHFLVASALLEEAVDAEESSTTKGKTAEAYYLLGITETLVGNSFWVSEVEFYLETAIRMAPRETFALKAFDLLKTEIVYNYSGSSGHHIPDDVAQNLRQLEKLLQNSQGQK